MENSIKRKKVEIQDNMMKKPKNEGDLEVTGISRSGRVRKKSSKLMDFESPDDIEARFRKQPPPMKTMQGNYRTPESDHDFPDNGHMPKMEMDMDDGGSGSESDYFDSTMDNADSMDSMDSEEGAGSDPDRNINSPNELSSHTLGGSHSLMGNVQPSHSLYMMEKSNKKKLIVKDGKVVGRAKAQRKDKGKSRVTAYMLWARGARHDLLRKYPEMDFAAISKRLGEMWANVNFQERYVWKRKAKRFAMKKDQSEQVMTTKVITNAVPPPVRSMPAVQVANQHPRARHNSGQGKISLMGASNQSGVVTQASGGGPAGSGGVYKVTGCGATEVGAHLRLLGESLVIIGERLKEHEGQIAISGSLSVLLDTMLCVLVPLVCLTGNVPAIAPPQALLQDSLDNIAYIMPGL